MKLFDNLFNKNYDEYKIKDERNFADSSNIPIEEHKFYKPDDYYTIITHKGTPFEFTVIPFDERKKSSIPSKRGLYVPEILMLSFCNSFPQPKNGYPGYWWFKYGVRDVGKLLRSLEQRGFIKIDSETGKYMNTHMGECEKKENAYVEYTHKNSKLKTLTAWDMNKLVNENPDCDWLTIFCKITGQPKPIEKSESLDKYNSHEKARRIKNRVPINEIKNKYDFDKGFDKGYSHYLKGEQFRKLGYIYSAIDEFDEARENGYSAPALFWSYAQSFRKIKDYNNEVEILEEAFKRGVVDNRSRRFTERMEKAKKLKSKNN